MSHQLNPITQSFHCIEAADPYFYVKRAYNCVDIELQGRVESVKISELTIRVVNKIFLMSGLNKVQLMLSLSSALEEKKQIHSKIEIDEQYNIVSILCVSQRTF